MKRISSCRRGLVAAAALAVAAAAGPANATGTGLYALVGGAVVSLDGTNVTVIGAEGSYESRDSGLRGGLGLRVTDAMALELTGHTLGKFGVAAPKLETTAVTLWLVGLLPVSANLAVQAKIGSSVFDSQVGALSDTGGGISFGAGAAYRIIENLDITYDYERFQAKVFQGRSSYDVYSIGLKYHF
jgi:hypothetical protein